MPELFHVKDFWRFDIRVGFVKDAEKVPRSKKLIKLTVDFGNQERTIVAGIGDQFNPEDLKGRKMIFVLNLKPKKLMGIESQGMLLVADANGKLFIISLPDEVPPGAKVW
ncbi:MAG: methionine--tRNA ligase subunit beta [Thermoproteales archaeon]|nr:methionine--tRNA ligase subunit beta [Thermoproteales archaeon]